MNLRIFPVNFNKFRRLRRATASLASACVSSDRRFRSSQSLQACQDAHQLIHRSVYSEPFDFLSVADREILLRQQALDHAQAGDVLAAIDLYTQLIRFNPNNASHFNNRGLLYFQNGHHQRALLDYHRALMINPRLSKVYNNRGNCYAAFKNYEAAIADYEAAINLDPTDMRARLNLGITLRQLVNYTQAIEQFELALQCCQLLNLAAGVEVSTDIEGHLYAERGRTYHLTGDWNCAIADYHRALDYLPISGSATHASHRLRTHVKTWLQDLVSPSYAD